MISLLAVGQPGSIMQPDFIIATAATVDTVGLFDAALESAFKAWLDYSSFLEDRVASAATIIALVVLPRRLVVALSEVEPVLHC